MRTGTAGLILGSMPDPQTTNILLNVPARGSDIDQWDVPLNGNSSAIDGLFGGTQIISVASTPITLTSPSGSPTPSGGPTQAQNAVLSFTGAMTANVQVTLPLPGSYIVENLTTGNFVLTFGAASSGQVIAVEQGQAQRIYNNGTNVRFAGLRAIGEISIWAGLSAMPSWVGACTVPPYLLCDGTVYNFSAYPYLGKRLGSAFGGNGITTFGVPDLRGRMAIPYDGTGTRITAAGCGLSGQTLGATLDEQIVTLQRSDLPNVQPTFTGSSSSVSGSTSSNVVTGSNLVGGIAGSSGNAEAPQNATIGPVAVTGTVTPQGTVQSLNGGVTQTGHPNVQPSQVTGIAVIRAA